MASSAVVTTRASRATMNEAVAVRTRTQFFADFGCKPVMEVPLEDQYAGCRALRSRRPWHQTTDDPRRIRKIFFSRAESFGGLRTSSADKLAVWRDPRAGRKEEP